MDLSQALDGVMGIGGVLRDLVVGTPAWLLLVGVAPLLFLVSGASLGDFTRGERWAQATLRTLVLAGLALALAQPSLRRDASAVSVVTLVDVSDSVTGRDLDDARALVSAIQAATARPAVGRAVPARVVRFAAGPEEVVAAGGDASAAAAVARFPAPGGAATDLALAMGLGAGLFDPAGIPRLMIISDGEATSGDALAAAERAAARGGRVFVHTLAGARDLGDVAVASLTAPDEVRPHAPFDLGVHVYADRDGEARLRLERDGHPNAPQAERTVALQAGDNAIAWPTTVEEPGTSLFRMRVLAAGHDAHAENDTGVLAIATERDPRVLFIEGGALTADPAFARALIAEKIAVDVRGPDQLPVMPELERYDLVVLSDVARAALGDKRMHALDAFVRAGGGLLVAGGAQSFGAGGYAGSPLEAILPVRLDLPEKLDEATLALALVIDKSGSMSGPKMELTKEAARATAEMMPPSDLIAVIVFDSQASPVVRLQRAANRARILSDISRIQASGGTNILAGLREAIDELLSARARKKHVILLSDGQSGYDGITDLLETAAGAPITVSAVGVGEGADQTLLQMIASRGGGRFYQTRDPASIPRIFSKETSQVGRRSVVEEPTRVRRRKRAEALSGVALESAPPLRGYALTRPRAQADLILATDGGDPLLARWQVGLGQVTAWTSDLRARWSADWLRWPGFGKFWAQVVRSTMRRRASTHFPLKVTLDGSTVAVAIDAIGSDDSGNDQFLSGLDGHLEITTASAASTSDASGAGSGNRVGSGSGSGSGSASAPAPLPTRTIALPETAPGRYEASFSIDRRDAGALLLRAALTHAGAPIADAAGRLAIPFAPELWPRLPSTAAARAPGAGAAGSPTLTAIAARTGGREIGDITSPAGASPDLAPLLDPGADRRPTLQSIRAQVLLATLVLFLIDVLLRRVNPFTVLARLRRRRPATPDGPLSPRRKV